MAYGLSKLPFSLKEGEMKVGAWTDPDLIGGPTPDAVDPTTKFSGDKIGYIKQGTINVGLTREYVEALAGTPAKIVRKDLTRKQYFLEFELFQINGDLMALALGMDTDVGYTGGAKTFTIGHVGPDEPTQSENGYYIETQLTSGNNFYFAVYAGKVTTEDVSKTLAGTDYATTKVKVEAFPDDANFTDADADLRSYGSWWEQTA